MPCLSESVRGHISSRICVGCLKKEGKQEWQQQQKLAFQMLYPAAANKQNEMAKLISHRLRSAGRFFTYSPPIIMISNKQIESICFISAFILFCCINCVFFSPLFCVLSASAALLYQQTSSDPKSDHQLNLISRQCRIRASREFAVLGISVVRGFFRMFLCLFVVQTSVRNW